VSASLTRLSLSLSLWPGRLSARTEPQPPFRWAEGSAWLLARCRRAFSFLPAPRYGVFFRRRGSYARDGFCFAPAWGVLPVLGLLAASLRGKGNGAPKIFSRPLGALSNNNRGAFVPSVLQEEA
jgi:hypothetical protein